MVILFLFPLDVLYQMWKWSYWFISWNLINIILLNMHCTEKNVSRNMEYPIVTSLACLVDICGIAHEYAWSGILMVISFPFWPIYWRSISTYYMIPWRNIFRMPQTRAHRGMTCILKFIEILSWRRNRIWVFTAVTSWHVLLRLLAICMQSFLLDMFWICDPFPLAAS